MGWRSPRAQAAILLAVVAAGPGGSGAGAGLPPPVRPAFVVPDPKPLTDSRARYVWAPVLRALSAHSAPDATTPVIATLDSRTPEGTANIVLILGRTRAAGHTLWVHVSLPALPPGRTGWVARDGLGGYVEVRTRLDVDLQRFTAVLLRDGRRVFRARIGVGKPAWPTPTGLFYVRNKLSRFRSPFYGPIAFGTSARSSVLTDWPAGGFIGIHGTNQPELLPGRVSHGCIRMTNADVLKLERLMPVGTPLTIH
jgi:hypothetical protein